MNYFFSTILSILCSHSFFWATIAPILPVSDFIRQHTAPTTLGSPDAGWVILSSAESRIRHKIEEAGKPLKDWDINIYRGILTGYNDAFIIDGVTKDELIRLDAKSADIIRPVLRGRDIKKYRAEFADKWIIFTRRGIDINEYPAIREHLHKYYHDLLPKQDGATTGRKPGTYKWFEIQDSVAYWNHFEGEKVVWQELSRTGNAFCYVEEPMYFNNTAFMITGLPKVELKYLTAILNHEISLFYLEQVYAKLDETGWRWFKVAVEKIPVPLLPMEGMIPIANLVDDIQSFTANGTDYSNQVNELKRSIFSLYGFTDAETELLDHKIKSYFI